MTPVLTARVGIAAAGDAPVHAIALRCQVRIEPLRRPYTDDEAAGLLDLFGPRERWARHPAARSSGCMPPRWSPASPAPPRSTCRWSAPTTSRSPRRSTCTRCATATIPLHFLFSGTVFVPGERGFAVQQVPWDREDRYDLPVAVWRDLIVQHFPNTGWLRLRRDTLDALATYKSQRGLLGFDDAITDAAGHAPPRKCHEPGRPTVSRAIADAVLYEGYLLYPYRATSRKNQSRWQFGVLGPPVPPSWASAKTTRSAVQVSAATGRRRRSRSWCASCSCSAAAWNATAARRVRAGGRTECRHAVVAHLGRGGRARAAVRPVRSRRTGHIAQRWRSTCRAAATSKHWTAAGWCATRRELRAELTVDRGSCRRADPTQPRHPQRRRTGRREGRGDCRVADRHPPDPRGVRRRVRLAARTAGRCRRRGRALPAAPLLAGAGRAAGHPGSDAGLADHPLRPPRDRRTERRRPLRLHRDRRDPHAARHDDDRRGEGRRPAPPTRAPPRSSTAATRCRRRRC